MLGRLTGEVPVETAAQRDFFEPDLTDVKKKRRDFLSTKASFLKRLLVHRSPLMPTGLLIFCLDYAQKDSQPLGGVFSAVRARFKNLKESDLKELLDQFYEFRNTYIAHEKGDGLLDRAASQAALEVWVHTLQALHKARAVVGRS